MIVKLRPFNKDTDSGFIIDSMAKALYKEQFPDAKRYKKSWFESMHKEILYRIENSQVRIACSHEDDEFLLGYAIDDAFVFVKENYRKQGIATLLCENIKMSDESGYMTKLGKKIIQAKEAHLTNQEQPEDNKAIATKNIEKLIKSGFPIKVAKFDPALTSGYANAEYEFNMASTNKLRVPDEMYLTPMGVIVVQNGKVFGGTAYSWSV